MTRPPFFADIDPGDENDSVIIRSICSTCHAELGIKVFHGDPRDWPLGISHGWCAPCAAKALAA